MGLRLARRAVARHPLGLPYAPQLPGFPVVAVPTLPQGIGPNTAIFSLIDALMLRSLPVEKPSQLVVLKWSASRYEGPSHGRVGVRIVPSAFRASRLPRTRRTSLAV